VPPLTRRELLRAGTVIGAGAALGTLVPVLEGCSSVPPDPGMPVIRLASKAAFPDGMVAGSPTQTGIRLAVRVTGLAGQKRLQLQVASDPDFTQVVHQEDLDLSTLDLSVPVQVAVDEPTAMKPSTRYYYRLQGDTGVTSPVGSFVTARPLDDTGTVRFAYFSCQGWQAGYYPAHAALALEPDIDLALCVGDYIYELTDDTGPADRVDTIGASPGFAETLDEYRQKYQLYRSDPELQAMHAQHAFLAIWDNHELASDAAGHLQGLVPRVPVDQRTANGKQAFWDFQPMVRGSDQQPLHRTVRLGQMVEIFIIDLHSFNDPPGVNGTYLGAAQKQWLFDKLSSSQARWKIIATSTLMMSSDSSPGMPINLDQWDGYPDERRQLVQHIIDGGIQGVVAISGDAHCFIAAQVTTTGRSDGQPGLVEFCGGSISSQGPQNLKPGQTTAASQLEALFLNANPHVSFIDILSRGYAVVEASMTDLTVTFRSPMTVYDKSSPTRDLARFRVAYGAVSAVKL
jgi:alkaline phosphatase D